MGVILLVIVGVAAGFIATRLMRVELGALETVAVGVLGALIGGFALRLLLTVGGMLFGLIGAIAGACLLIWLYQRFLKSRR